MSFLVQNIVNNTIVYLLLESAGSRLAVTPASGIT